MLNIKALGLTVSEKKRGHLFGNIGKHWHYFSLPISMVRLKETPDTSAVNLSVSEINLKVNTGHQAIILYVVLYILYILYIIYIVYSNVFNPHTFYATIKS